MTNHTTALTLVVKLHLRYETTNHQPVTHTIAIGPSVGVNTIIGKPFLQSLQCVYDSYNNVMEARLLDTAPFNIVDLQPQRYKTDQLVVRSSVNPSYASIIKKLRDYESILTTRKQLPSLFEDKTVLSTTPPIPAVATSSATCSHFGGDKLASCAPCAACGAGVGFQPADTSPVKKRSRFHHDFVTDDEGSTADMLLDE